MLELLFDTPPRDPAEILRTVFGHQSFRGQQEDVVRHVTAGGDAVVLFPTGAGKSMCFQVPALARKGVGIVVSPLIALMRDQVEALKQAGVNAATLNSSVSSETRPAPSAISNPARSTCSMSPPSGWCCPASSR